MTWKTMDTPPAHAQKVLVVWPTEPTNVWMATFFQAKNSEDEDSWITSAGTTIFKKQMVPLFWMELPDAPITKQT